MYIKEIEIENFANISNIKMKFSPNINIFIGENGVGKTNILKLIYSTSKVMDDIKSTNSINSLKVSKERTGEMIAEKLNNVFRANELGRLVKRKVGRGKSNFTIIYKGDERINFAFSTLSKKKVDLIEDVNKENVLLRPVFIPPKEIISSIENFTSVYESYHIAFEETYYDLAKLLLLPTKKGEKTEKQRKQLKDIENIIEGKVVFKNNQFYLKAEGFGELEMGLLAEGYRKWSTILQLIQNGVLSENSVLFWDEPETNSNPKLIKPLVNLLITLSKLGVQIFIATHSYFIIQEFDLYSKYDSSKDKSQVNYYSLYKNPESGEIEYEVKQFASELTVNSIEDQFNELYNQEQELFYDTRRG